MEQDVRKMKKQLTDLCESMNQLARFARSIGESMRNQEMKLELMFMKLTELEPRTRDPQPESSDARKTDDGRGHFPSPFSTPSLPGLTRDDLATPRNSTSASWSPLSASKSTPDLTIEGLVCSPTSSQQPKATRSKGSNLAIAPCKRRRNRRVMQINENLQTKSVGEVLSEKGQSSSVKVDDALTTQSKKISSESGVFSSDDLFADDIHGDVLKETAASEDIPASSPSGDIAKGDNDSVKGDERKFISGADCHTVAVHEAVTFDEEQTQMPNQAELTTPCVVTIEVNNDKNKDRLKTVCDVNNDEQERPQRAEGASHADILTAVAPVASSNGSLPVQPQSLPSGRRATYAGMTFKQQETVDVPPKDKERRVSATSAEIIRARSSCDLVTHYVKRSDASDDVMPTSVIDRVKRQFSNSSTNSAPGGIHIRLGADSDSDDDVEIKLPDIAAPIFSHRVVSIKNSTYKHFYDLKEPIGGGRFGRVYHCTEKKTGLHLAAKCFVCKKPVTKSLLNSKSLKMKKLNLQTKRTQQEPVEKSDVMMEIAIMNQIDHENVVKLYDAYENDNTMTLILEYLSGGELFERVLADQSQLTELDAVLFMQQIIKAIQYLHKTLILHLDLKPENILCLDRSTHHLKIIDFGLARKYVPRQKLVIQWGTPEFMAPEILNYESVSCASDMWSVGVICYILLSGISPFLGDTDSDTMENTSGCAWDFEDEQFNTVSDEAKDFISRLLVIEKSGRMSAAQCLRHEWLSTPLTTKRRRALMNKSHLKNFMARMHWKASIAAVQAANWLRSKIISGSDSDVGSSV